MIKRYSFAGITIGNEDEPQYVIGYLEKSDIGNWVEWKDVESIITKDNKYEIACKEFLKGCSNVSKNHQEDCPECLKAFCDYLRELADEEKYKTNEHIVFGRTII